MSRFSDLLRRNIVFVQVFCAVAGISTVAVLVASLLVFRWFEAQTLADIGSANRLSLLNVRTTLENYFDSASANLQQLYQNASVRNILYSENREWDDNFSAAAASTVNSLSVNTFVDSIYLFGSQGLRLKTSSTYIPESFEATFRRVSLTGTPFLPTPVVVADSGGNPVHLLSFLMKEAAGDGYDSAVVVNVSMDRVAGHLLGRPLAETQTLSVIDASGTLLIHPDMKRFGQGLDPRGTLARVLKDDGGRFEESSSRGVREVDYLWSADRRFGVILETDRDVALGSLLAARSTTVAILLSSLASVLGLSLLVTLWIYRPIRKVFADIRNLARSVRQEPEGLDEIQSLTQATVSLGGTLQSLGNQVRRSALDMVFSLEDHGEPDEAALDFWDGWSPPRNVTVAVLRLPLSPEVEGASRTETILTLVTASLGAQHTFLSFARDPRQLVLVVRAGGIVTHDALVAVGETALRVLGVRFSAGVAGPASTVGELRGRYREAVELARYPMLLGEGVVVGPGHEGRESLSDEGLHRLHQARAAAKRRDAREYREAAEAFLRECRQLTYAAASGACVQFVVAVLANLEEAGLADVAGEWANVKAMERRLDEAENPGMVLDWFLEVYGRVTGALEEASRMAAGTLVGDALAYLAEHYGDPSLSAVTVAERLGLSPSHFSRSFRKVTRRSFPEYMTGLRLARAKELLSSEPTLDVTEVMARVGYSHPSYFAAAFRKAYGVTPSAFKLRSQSREAR